MRKTVWLLLFICMACKSKPNGPLIHVSLTHGSRSIQISGLDASISGEIGRDTASGLWQTLMPVYRLPADTDLKNYQPVQHGKYVLRDTAVVFTPDTPLQKGQTYFLRFYHFDGADGWDIVKSRKRVGEVKYTDFIVSP